MVHKFTQCGLKLALDSNSSAVHLLDGTAYDLLDFAGEEMPEKLPDEALSQLSNLYSAEALEESWSELYEVHCQGRLFSKYDYENIKPDLDAPIKSMCLNISHDCNLRCRYCFASTGDFGKGRKLMPLEVAKKAVDFLIRNSGSRHNLELDFFGGEPLMNFDVVKKTVEYGRAEEKKHNKNIRFTITTNGVLLDDEKIDFINREMSNAVLSIDGRREVNDQMRPRADGSGSYDQILQNFKALCKKRAVSPNTEYYVRGTYTNKNLDFVRDVLSLYHEGFDQISVEPVVTAEDKPYALRESDLPAIFDEYDRLTSEIVNIRKQGEKINFFHFMIDLDEGPCAIKLLKGCGCGNEYVAVTPDGDIYPCHQFVGDEKFIMGNVMTEEGVFKSPMKTRFAQANINTKRDCKNCWAKFFCGGGCNANNYSMNGDITKSYRLACELERKRVECAIALKAVFAD